MKNKKGITLGRVILYILSILLFLAIIWVFVLTYREIAKNPNKTTKIECNNSLRLQNENDIPVNLYNYDAFPFYNKNYDGNISSYSLSTGAFTFLKAGTYTISFTNYNTNYACRLIGYKNASFIINVNDYNTLWTDWISFTSSYSFTLNTDSYLCLYSTRYDSGICNLSDFVDFDVMLNEGSTAQNYIPYIQNYQNANTYISNCYFVGNGYVYESDFYGYSTYVGCYSYLPFRYPSISVSGGDFSAAKKTDYVPSINNSILNLGSSISSLYSSINNSTYSFYNQGYNYNNVSYNSSIENIYIYFECASPIPVYLFNFDLAGSDLLLNSSCVVSLKCNNDINLVIPFTNLYSFDYQSILNLNPNVSTIYNFSFLIYFNNITNYNSSLSSKLVLQNKSWSTYSSSCNLFLNFHNFFGSDDWTLGYQEGFRNGQSSADEALQVAYDNAMVQVNDLTSQVTDLTSRVNSQSEIITNLQDQINNANLGFKNFFFTMADVPFKTVSNVLGFEVFGLNLFQFFTGILTALGCIWLIKKFL